MGNFVTDRKQGDIAEEIALSTLKKELPLKNFKRVIGKNSDYDIVEDTKKKDRLTIEVKFDIKAIETGNLCFEFTNGNKPTGVCVSKAKEIWYVLKTKSKNEYLIIKFDRATLLQKLLYYSIVKPTKGIRLVYGGDNKSFGLILIPVKTVLEENFGTLIKVEKNGQK